MDLKSILNIDSKSILKHSKNVSVPFGVKLEQSIKTSPSDLIHNIPCYFSKDQMELYEKVIQLHYSDILQLINNKKIKGEISDYIKNAMDLLAINLESVSIHPYVLIMSKLPNSNRQLVFKEFVKSHLLAKSGKLHTLKTLIDNYKENKLKKNIIVYFRGDFNINELYDFEKTNYKHLSFVPGDIDLEHQLRRNTVTDIKINMADIEIKNEEEDEDDDEDDDEACIEEVEEEENNSNSEEEQNIETKNTHKEKKSEENIQNSIGGRSPSSSLSSTTQPTRICDILEAVLTASFTQPSNGKLVVKRYDGKKPLKRGSANNDDGPGSGNKSFDDLYVHLVSNMEAECPVTNADLVISLDSTYPSFESLKNIEGLKLYSPYSIDHFLMIKEMNDLDLENVIMNTVCNKINVGSLTDDWIIEYLEGLKNVSSGIFNNGFVEKNFIIGNKLLTEKILERSDDLFGEFLQNYVDSLDSGDSIFNFLRFVKNIDSKINFSELSDTDLVNVKKLIKNNIYLSDNESTITRNTFKINKNLVINFDQRILYQLNRGFKRQNSKNDYDENACSLLYSKVERLKNNLDMSINLNEKINNEIEFYEEEFNKILHKITIDGIKFTEDTRKEIERCLSRQEELRNEIFQATKAKKETSSCTDLVLLERKALNKRNEADYLKQELEKAQKSIIDSDVEILALQEKIQALDQKVTESVNNIKEYEAVDISNFLESEKRKVDNLLDEATEIYTNIKELPSKRSKRQRRR
ncbi:hypothetical protein QEN19_000837 [Hanseniaspora menglaensis]